MTPAEFLLARIADDEDGLREPDAREREWRTNSGDYNEGALLWFEDRLRAECHAKRAIVEPLGAFLAETGLSPWKGCNDDCEYVEAEWVLIRMAAVYADHPDYDPVWSTAKP